MPGSRIDAILSTVDNDCQHPSHHRQPEPLLPGAADGELVAGIGVPHHAGAGIVPQHAADAPLGGGRAVADDHHAGVMEADPVAPLAVLSSALSSGQSETASLPSCIASVSRFGEATEPESR